MKILLVYKNLSFRLVLTILLCGLALPAFAAAKPTTKTAALSIDGINSLYQLRFHTEFFSSYPNYPHSRNLQRGRVHIKQTKKSKTIFAKKLFKPAPFFLKRAITSATTINHFAETYAFYKNTDDIKAILKCPALSTQFELDNNKSTKEWLVSLSLKYCLNPKSRGVDQYPHMWVLQQNAKGQYRVLLEGDDKITITVSDDKSDSGYKVAESDIFLNKLSKKESKKCGGATVSWRYMADRYRPTQREYHHVDCDSKKSKGATLRRYSKKHLKAIRPEVNKIITSLAFNTGDSTQTIIKSKVKPSPQKVANSNTKSLLKIISMKDLQKLLK